MNKIEQSTSMISEATPEVECSIHSTARRSRKARAFSFSPSTSPAMVPTRQGMTASVERGTVPKPVPVNASGGKTIAGKPSKSVRSSTSQSTVASLKGSIGSCGCKSHRAVHFLPRAIRAHKTRLYMAKQVLGRAPAGFFLPLRTVPSSGFAPCIWGDLSGRQSPSSGTAKFGAHLAAGTGVFNSPHGGIAFASRCGTGGWRLLQGRTF